MSSVLDRIRAKQAALASVPLAPAVPAPAPAVPAPAPAVPAGLNFDDREVADYTEKVPRIPWDLILDSTLELQTLIHINGRKGPFYKATVRVLVSDSEMVRVGQEWSLLYYYRVDPRDEKEKYSNKCVMREMRALAAAVSGEANSPDFEASTVIGELVKASTEDQVLGLPFKYSQQAYPTPEGKMKVRSSYSPA